MVLKRSSQSGKKAFTLLEMVVVIALTGLLLGIAMPSIDDLWQDQALQAKLDSFNKIVRTAQSLAHDRQAQTYVTFEEERVFIYPEIEEEEGFAANRGLKFMALGEKELFEMTKPYALQDAPTRKNRWAFWPTGNCEPVTIKYSGPSGTWTQIFDPLSASGRITEYELP